MKHVFCVPTLYRVYLQDIKQLGGIPAIAASLLKIKAEAERLEVTDKAAGILAELLYTDHFLTEIKQYRTIMLHVRHWLNCASQSDFPFLPLLLYLVCCGESQSSEIPIDWL